MEAVPAPIKLADIPKAQVKLPIYMLSGDHKTPLPQDQKRAAMIANGHQFQEALQRNRSSWSGSSGGMVGMTGMTGDMVGSRSAQKSVYQWKPPGDTTMDFAIRYNDLHPYTYPTNEQRYDELRAAALHQFMGRALRQQSPVLVDFNSDTKPTLPSIPRLLSAPTVDDGDDTDPDMPELETPGTRDSTEGSSVNDLD